MCFYRLYYKPQSKNLSLLKKTQSYYYYYLKRLLLLFENVIIIIMLSLLLVVLKFGWEIVVMNKKFIHNCSLYCHFLKRVSSYIL